MSQFAPYHRSASSPCLLSTSYRGETSVTKKGPNPILQAVSSSITAARLARENLKRHVITDEVAWRKFQERLRKQKTYTNVGTAEVLNMALAEEVQAYTTDQSSIRMMGSKKSHPFGIGQKGKIVPISPQDATSSVLAAVLHVRRNMVKGQSSSIFTKPGLWDSSDCTQKRICPQTQQGTNAAYRSNLRPFSETVAARPEFPGTKGDKCKVKVSRDLQGVLQSALSVSYTSIDGMDCKARKSSGQSNEANWGLAAETMTCASADDSLRRSIDDRSGSEMLVEFGIRTFTHEKRIERGEEEEEEDDDDESCSSPVSHSYDADGLALQTSEQDSQQKSSLDQASHLGRPEVSFRSSVGPTEVASTRTLKMSERKSRQIPQLSALEHGCTAIFDNFHSQLGSRVDG